MPAHADDEVAGQVSVSARDLLRAFLGNRIERGLDKRDRTLASCRQSDIDAWYAQNTEHARKRLRAFLTWAKKSRQCSRSLSLPPMKISRRTPMTENERLAALRRLLIDADVPQLLRVAGIIVLLYAQPLTRVVRLTTDDLLRDGEALLLR
ncbi:hypothetical protein ACWDLG_29070, partial [Nonomuraea sp. NPDC003727]